MRSKIKIIECPRDAMQGITSFIPTEKKIEYINQLLKVGFDTIDFGSFVSPKTVPQLRDTSKVLEGLNLNNNNKLLAITANFRGAKDACNFDEISYLGFPLSVSEEFQKRNTNQTIEEALIDIENIQDLVLENNKILVVYLSMAFGNPYGESYNIETVGKLVTRLNAMNINIIALSDTIGISEPDNISILFKNLISEYPDIEFGAHFHTIPEKAEEKINAAYNNGCRRFDTVIKGYGGCPMAENKLTGNMPTEIVYNFFNSQAVDLNLDYIVLQDIVEKMSIYFEV